MKKLIILISCFALMGCGGGDTASDSESSSDSAAATNETSPPDFLEGHWTLQSSDCVALEWDTGGTLTKTDETRSQDGLNSIVEIYRGDTDNPDLFDVSNDVRFNVDQGIVAECILPDVVPFWTTVWFYAWAA